MGELEAREKAGRAETARATTKRLQEVIHRGVVIQAETAAEAHKAQMETAMARSLQAVSEGAVIDAAQMEAELLAQVETTEVTEPYEARMHRAEQLIGPAGIQEQRMLLQRAAQAVEARKAVEQGLQPRQDDEGDRH